MNKSRIVDVARVLERANLQRALKQARQNKGASGIDGMTVDVLPEYLKHHWPDLRAKLIAGTYRPQPEAPMRVRIEPIRRLSSPVRLAAGHGADFKRVANARSGTNEEWQQC